MAITVDTTLSTTSTNPVENKAITLALNGKADSSSLPHGVPSGGTTGQVLVKSSNSDYAVQWQTVTTPSGTKNISISSNGTTTENVTNYATASITVSVPTGTARDSSDLTANNLTVTAPAGLYASNASKTLSDANLIASNIKKDVTIFSVTGSYEGSGGGISLDDFLSRTEPVGAVSIQNTTRLYGYAFYNNAVMTSISAPSMIRLGIYDFGKCTNLVNVYMPELIYAYFTDKSDGATVSNTDSCYAFYECHSLGNVNLPKLQTAGLGLFYRVGNGQNVYNAVIVLPAISFLGNNAFRQGKFKAIDLGPNYQKVWNDSFYGGTYDVVILRSTTLVVANTRDAVRNITTLYAPAALVSDYATASNWSTDAANRTVYAIEGSQYEHYYADGTAIPT